MNGHVQVDEHVSIGTTWMNMCRLMNM